MLFMGRSLRSCLDILTPDICKHVQVKQCSPSQLKMKLRTFDAGHRVFARDYRSPTQKWQSGEILSQTGSLSYTVSVGPTMVWRRQIDQLLDAAAGDVTAQPEGFETPQDSEDTPMAPDCVTGDNGTQVPENVDSTLQSVTDSEFPVRHYPVRSLRPPQRLDL